MKPRLCVELAAALAFIANASAELLVHHTFDGDTGNIATDSATAGGTTNATITGGAFITDPERGAVLSMTGTGSNGAFAAINCPSTTGAYTFAGWYKGTDTSGYWYDQGPSNRLIPSLGSFTDQDANDGGTGPGLGAYDGGAWKNSAAGAATWTTGEWVHIAWVFENDGLGAGTDSVSIYVNGVAQDVDPGTVGLQAKRAIANIPALGGTQRLFARNTGSDDSSQLTGLIDDFRIYDHALSASQIAALVNPPPAITYIDADNTPGTGNTVLDGPGSFGPTTGSSVVEAADGLWSIRERPAANGGGILAAHHAEDATPRLATTFTLPGPGLYTIYGYFWNNVGGSGVWDAQFKLGTVRPAVLHTKTTAENLGTSSNHFTLPNVSVNDGALVLCEAVLGTWNTATEGFTVTIYTDDPETGGEPGNTEDRTWFDGVGHSLSTLNFTPGVDSDGDGLDNVSEVNTHGTDPTIADTDGDGRSDGVEVATGTNPLLPDLPPLPPGLPSDAVRIQTDGAWSWFNDHTARFVNGDLYVGYVKGQAKKMAMTRYDFDTSTAHEFEFSTATNPSNDDHDVPTIAVLPDGKILSVYSRHNVDTKFFYRRSLNGNPAGLADWSPEQTKTLGTAKNTYSNTFRLSAESDKIYNFSRNINFNPVICTSTDAGQTWSDPIHFIKTGTGGTRPYPRYATNHHSRIDLIYTDGHPRDVNNSIYHLFYQGGNFHKSDGSIVKAFANLPLEHTTGERGTVVYPFTTAAWGPGQGPDDWIPNGRAWTWDIHYQSDGKPVCVFQVQVDGVTGPATDFKNDRIYYYYARWDGNQWRKKFIANAGRGLFSSEDDYGGGMCIDPENPAVIYISSNATNPFDLTTLAPALNPNNEIYEIYRGTTADGGATWNWQAITADSDASNMRPFVPEDHGRTNAVVWFRGRYTTYLNYDCDIYGVFSTPPAPGLSLRQVRWSPGAAALKWTSIPGQTYRIAASLDLMNFPIDIANGVSSQGDTTYQPFTFPPVVTASPKAFFRVEAE